MAFITDPEVWGRLFTIVVIDLMLAGDNALVIALAVRALPRRQQLWGRVFGTAGAVILRLAFITLATFLLKIPFLQLGGGVMLAWIAVKLIRENAGVEGHVRPATSLWDAIRVIVVADAVMSVDNVLGIAGAARGDLGLVVFGIALSLPLVVWGSGILTRVMDRLPWVIWLGGAILGYVAGEMMLDDPAVTRWLGSGAAVVFGYAFPMGLALGIVALGRWLGRTRRPEVSECA